jgi:hypothetical protein
MNQDEDSSPKQGDSLTPSKQKILSIFTENDVKDTVKKFILGWINGTVSINFPTADEIYNRSKKEKTGLDYKEAVNQEVQGKLQFVEYIQIIIGNKPATKQEQEFAMSLIFERLLAYRCGGRIVGTFGKQEDYEARLNKIEEEISAMNESIQQLIIWYRSFLQRK